MRQFSGVFLGLLALAYSVNSLPYNSQLNSGSNQFLDNEQDGPYPAAKDSVPAKPFNTGFIECYGTDFACVNENLCINGRISSDKVFGSRNQNKQCELARNEVCCKVEIPVTVVAGGIIEAGTNLESSNGYLPPPSDESFDADTQNQAFLSPPRPPVIISEGSAIKEESIPEPIQLGCAAALNCVDERFCTKIGMISKTPVNLTPEQFLRSVPMVKCRIPETGAVGRCCRDPDYVDPWPQFITAEMKKDGFDEQGFAINLPKITVKKPDTPVVQQTFVPQQPTFEPSRIQQRPNLIPNPVRPFNPPQNQQFPDASSTSSVNAQPPLVSSGSAILAPSVVPGYIPPTTDVRDFIEPHEAGKQCGLLNKGHC